MDGMNKPLSAMTLPLLGVLLLTGCSQARPTGNQTDQLVQDHAQLGSALNAYAQALNSFGPNSSLNEVVTATEPPQDALAVASSTWLEHASAWDLSESPADGMPSRESVAAFNEALRTYVADSEAASVYFATCATSAEPTVCIAAHQDEYAAMSGHQRELLAASEVLVRESNSGS